MDARRIFSRGEQIRGSAWGLKSGGGGVQLRSPGELASRGRSQIASIPDDMS